MQERDSREGKMVEAKRRTRIMPAGNGNKEYCDLGGEAHMGGFLQGRQVM